MERVAKKNNAKVSLTSEEGLKKNLHKIYLILAIFFGLLLSVGMPFFYEPDGVYHYVVSSNVVGLTNDISRYGETSSWGGGPQNIHELPAVQNGTYFQKYYETKVALMPISKLPRSNSYPAVLSYDFGGHLIPGIGIWLGYHIYPSMGVMITFGRLLTMFVYSLAMLFIIKFLKKGKLLFATLSLSPVVLNTFSSLSYDGLSFVLSALLVMLTINTIVDGKVGVRRIFGMAVTALAILFWGKTNVIVILLAFAIAIISALRLIGSESLHSNRYSRSLRKLNVKSTLRKRGVVIGVAIIVLLGVIIFSLSYGGLLTILYQLFINFGFNFNTGNFDITSVFVRPMGNYMPVWLTAVWFVLVAVSAFAEDKFFNSRLISMGSFLVVILEVLSVYLGYIRLNLGTGVAQNDIMGYIAGIQGRYVLPSLFLLPLVVGNERLKASFKSYQTAVLLMVAVVVISGGLWFFDTWFSAVYLNL